MRFQSLKKLFFILLLAVIAPGCNIKSSSHAQNNSPTNLQKQTDYIVEGSVYKKAVGWELPNIAEFDIKEQRREVKVRTDVPANVYETHYIKYPGQVISFPPDDRPDAFRMKVTEVWEYDVNEHKFAYKILETPYSESGVTVSTVGYLIYYDENGNGKFELIETDWNKPLRIPAWALK
jgi:hypothetical protein